MVLSNKKLKQNLRAARAEFLTAEVASVAFVGSSPETKTEPSGLRELLEAAKKHGPKLSKREKRRKTQSSLGLDGEIEIPISGNGEESEKVGDKGSKGEEKEVGLVDERGQNGKEEKKKIKKKKRKRGETEEKGLEAYSGEVKEAKNEKKKTKKKKKKKKKKKGKTVEGEKKDDEEEVGAEAKYQVIERRIDEEVATKVYVGGIPYYSTEDDIRSYFEGCGTITEIDCMTFPDSGKFRGIAIISFKTDAAVKRALALDGSDMGGFYLKIKPYKTTRSNKVTNFAPDIVEGYNRIYCGNLSWDITEDDLKKFFSGCNIVSIRFGMDKDSGEFRGYAHVDFSDNSSIALALKLDQQIVCGRPVKISRAVPPKKGVTIPPVAVPSSNESNDGGLSAGSGKKKRRTCYECGEKGHISTDCPKKQAADPTDSKTS